MFLNRKNLRVLRGAKCGDASHPFLYGGQYYTGGYFPIREIHFSDL